MSWSAFISGGFGVAVVSGLVMIVRAVLGRPLIQASAAEKVSDTALAHVEQARDDARQAFAEARSARQDAEQARRDASEARREASEARREATDAAREMRRLKSAILNPSITVEQLRAMVSDPPGNGMAFRS